MVKKVNDAMLWTMARGTNRLAALKVTRDQRGQAFTDYLIVIALVAVLIAFISPTAKDGVNAVVEQCGTRCSGWST